MTKCRACCGADARTPAFCGALASSAACKARPAVAAAWRWGAEARCRHRCARDNARSRCQTISVPQRRSTIAGVQNAEIGDRAENGEASQEVLPETLEDGIAILWFRDDLRLADNCTVQLACTAQAVLPVYVFDPANFGASQTSYGFQNMGPFKAYFIHEAVSALRLALRNCRSDLYTFIASADTTLAELIEPFLQYEMPIYVVAEDGISCNARSEQRRVQRALADAGLVPPDRFILVPHNNCTLPLMLEQASVLELSSMTLDRFRAVAMSADNSPAALPAPEDFPPIPEPAPRAGKLPLLRDELQIEGTCEPLNWPFPDPKACFAFQGGEEFARERLDVYLWRQRAISVYERDRKYMGSAQTSTKLSPSLSVGCISAARLFRELRRYEKRTGPSEDARLMFDNLLMRDVLRAQAWARARKHEADAGGSRATENAEDDETDEDELSDEDDEMVERWIEGITGFPFIDACMRELKATGFLTFDARRAVASFLLHVVKVSDYRVGAQYFRSVLIDYDEAVNEHYWALAASSPPLDLFGLALEVDPDGWYTAGWCPELVDVPAPSIWALETLTPEERSAYDLDLGFSYPLPMLNDFGEYVPFDAPPPSVPT